MLKHLRTTVMVLTLIFFISGKNYAQTPPPVTGGKNIVLQQGSFITFRANSTGGNLYQWFKDGLPIAGETAQTLKVTEAGTYSVQSTNNANCSSIMSEGFKVVVNQTIVKQADLNILKKSEIKTTGINQPYEYSIQVTNKGPDKAMNVIVKDVFPEGLILTDANIPAIGRYNYDASQRTIIWHIDSLLLAQTEELRFKAEAVNPGKVSNTASVKADETDPVPANNQSTDEKEITDILVPNVFTPNGDGVNDVFEIRNLDLYKANEISIINRWGNVVYDTKDYNNVWNGNGLDEGTYFYVLKVRNATGTWKVYKGYVTLLRTKTL